MRKSRSRAVAEIDTQTNAKVDAILAQMDRTRQKVQEKLSAARAVDLEKMLAAHPDADGLDFQKLIAAMQKLESIGTDRTMADERRAEIIRMSLAGISVGQMAEKLGLSYYYVVQVRRELGLSRPRKPR